MTAVEPMRLSRGGFDVGLLTASAEAMLDFWHGRLGLPVERTLQPVPGVTQHKLTLRGAVLKLNCLDETLPHPGRLGGIRMLLLADADVQQPEHLRDPDGNLVCRVPTGHAGIDTFGVHLAVSDEAAFHRFYRDVLGLVAVGERTYELGGATISFSWSPDVVPGDGTGGAGFGYLTFQVMDAVEAHALVCGRGGREDRSPSSAHTATDSTISFVLDPDGNRIELSQRPDLVTAALRGLAT